MQGLHYANLLNDSKEGCHSCAFYPFPLLPDVGHGLKSNFVMINMLQAKINVFY